MRACDSSVVPFRPCPPESLLHQDCADFDWLAALRMVCHSASLACRCQAVALTDVDTDLPVPMLRYETQHRRLMLWTLEVCLRYLESKDFDHDTIMLDVDQLVFQDLSPWFSKAALTVCVRPTAKHTDGGQPLLNGVQWWRAKQKMALIDFYREALRIAEQLPEAQKVWGADTEAVRQMLEPIEVGFQSRAGALVRMVDAREILEAFSTPHEAALLRGDPPFPRRPVLDFRWRRKAWMRPSYEATFAAGAVA